MGVVHVVQVGRDGQQERVEEGAPDDAHQQHADVVPELVREESDHGWSDEDTEGKDGVHQSDVDIVDANVFHVDGQVRHDGKGGAIEEEQGELERQHVHVDHVHHGTGSG